MAPGSSRSKRKACKMAPGSTRSNSVLEVLDKNMLSTKLEEAAQKQKLVVLEFMADWNVPCKNMKKDLDTMAAEFANRVMFLALNIDKFKDIAESLSVQVLPTFLLGKSNDVEFEVVIGVKKKELEEKIRKHTDNVTTIDV